MLPFSSARQATKVRQDVSITDDVWNAHRMVIRAEDRLSTARTERRVGRNSWSAKTVQRPEHLLLLWRRFRMERIMLCVYCQFAGQEYWFFLCSLAETNNLNFMPETKLNKLRYVCFICLGPGGGAFRQLGSSCSEVVKLKVFQGQ